MRKGFSYHGRLAVDWKGNVKLLSIASSTIPILFFFWSVPQITVKIHAFLNSHAIRFFPIPNREHALCNLFAFLGLRNLWRFRKAGMLSISFHQVFFTEQIAQATSVDQQESAGPDRFHSPDTYRRLLSHIFSY